LDDLKRYALFAEVVRSGSMSAAARHLRVSTSAVSQQLRQLEQAYGVTLLHRSTRKLSLTETGLRFAEHCRAMVEAADRAQAQLLLARDAPEGELRVAAPVGFARHIAPALASLLARYTALRLNLHVDDALIDLIDARVDLAIRGGSLPDSSWVAQPLGCVHWLLCAAPSYLARAGMPETPAELLAHQWIAVPRDSRGFVVELQGPAGERETLHLEPRVASNNQFTVQQLCAAGLGIARGVRPDFEEDLRQGRLIPVLQDWKMAPIPMFAVTPQRDGQPAKVRHAIEAIRAYLRQVPGVSA